LEIEIKGAQEDGVSLVDQEMTEVEKEGEFRKSEGEGWTYMRAHPFPPSFLLSQHPNLVHQHPYPCLPYTFNYNLLHHLINPLRNSLLLLSTSTPSPPPPDSLLLLRILAPPQPDPSEDPSTIF